MTSDTMDDEEGGADALRQGRNTNRAGYEERHTWMRRRASMADGRLAKAEKQPASNAGEKKKEIVTTCSRD